MELAFGLFLGFCVGVVVGAGSLALLLTARENKKESFSKAPSPK